MHSSADCPLQKSQQVNSTKPGDYYGNNRNKNKYNKNSKGKYRSKSKNGKDNR